MASTAAVPCSPRPALRPRQRALAAAARTPTASKPSWRASDCSAAGESARRLGGAVNQARSQSGSSAASMPPRPCPPARPSRAPAAAPARSGSERASAVDRGGVVRAVEHRQRALVHDLQPARHLGRGGGRARRPARRARSPRCAGTPPRRRARARSCAAGSAPRASSSIAPDSVRPRARSAPRARAPRARRPPAPPARAASPSTSVPAARTTASFSSAMSVSVGPSQRVCSSPTFVSTVTRRVDHARGVIAPAEAGLDDRDLHARARPAPKRRRGEQFELGDVVVLGQRAVDPLRRPRRPRDRRGELARVEVPLADPHAFAVGDQVRRECTRPSAGRGARRIAAVMRVVEVLPFVPSTWIASKRRSGEPSTVIIRRIRSKPKRIPNSSSERRCALGVAPRSSPALVPYGGGQLCVRVSSCRGARPRDGYASGCLRR